MKNICKFMGIIALVAVIGFGAALTACSDGGGGGGSGGGGSGGGGGGTTPTQTFTSIADFDVWLYSQPYNTAATAYNVKLNINDLGDFNEIVSSLFSRYANLDFSGSTFTSINSDVLIQPGITSITIPASVTSITSSLGYIFSNGTMTAINVDTANTVYSSQDGVLYNKVKTILIRYPCNKTGTFIIPNSVTKIGDYAFYDCCYRLTSVTIPNSVISIKSGAFYVCTSLISVTFATGSNISDANFGSVVFPEGDSGYCGDSLKTAYLVASPKAGTYTRAANGSTWTKNS